MSTVDRQASLPHPEGGDGVGRGALLRPTGATGPGRLPDEPIPARLWPAISREAPGRRRFALYLMLVFGCLYTMTAARSLPGGDSGEFLVIAYAGGVAHPPGYPLYSLLARAVATIPVSNPTFPLALLSAAFAVAALAVLYAGLRRWGMSRVASATAAAVLGVSPAFWRLAGIPEVFSLNALLAAGLLWAAGRGPGPRGGVRAGLLGALLGLGLSNHHSLLLLAPIVAAGLIRALRETPARRLWIPLVFLATLAIGLLPYLTLLGSHANAAWAWGGDLDVAGLLHHVLRRDYGTFALAAQGDPSIGPTANPLAYLARLPNALHVLVPLGVVGIALAAISSLRFRRNLDDALDGSALLLSFGLSALVFLALFNLRPSGLSGEVVERFYVLPDLLFVALGAVGLEKIASWAPRQRVYMASLAVGVVCVAVVANVDRCDWSDERAVEDYLLDALDTAAPGSVIVGGTDLQLFGFLVASEVFAYRTDVVYVDVDMLRYRWYYDRIRARLPKAELTFDAETTHVGHLFEKLLAKYPIFLADPPFSPAAVWVPTAQLGPGAALLPLTATRWSSAPDGPLLHLLRAEALLPLTTARWAPLSQRIYPLGPLFGVARFGTPLPSPFVLEHQNRELFDNFRAPPAAPTRSQWSRLALGYYARAWRVLSDAYGALGHPDRALAVRQLARPFDSR